MLFSWLAFLILFLSSLYPRHPTLRGRHHETSCWRGGMRRLRAGLVTSPPGGLGSPSAPTTRGRSQGAGRGPDERGGNPPGSRRAYAPCPSPEVTVPKPKIAAVERRKARRPRDGRRVPSGDFGPSARRARGAALRTGACRRFTPSGFARSLGSGTTASGRRKTAPEACTMRFLKMISLLIYRGGVNFTP